MSAEGKRLRKIRDRLAALGSMQWFLSTDGVGQFLEAKLAEGDMVRVARFEAAATADEIEFFASAPEDMAFAVRLLDRAIASIRRDRPASPTEKNQDRKKDYATEAAMKCSEPAFKVYLQERHGLESPMTDERVAIKLRSVLGITSRRELNSDAQAAERWRALRADYTAWRRAVE